MLAPTTDVPNEDDAKDDRGAQWLEIADLERDLGSSHRETEGTGQVKARRGD